MGCWCREFGGAFGDLGTFLPHVLGAITVAGLAPTGVLMGFGLFLIGSGWFYGVPMAVQPMKAVSAVVLTADLSPGEVAATGLMLGAILLLLGLFDMMERLARAIPRSVTAGLQLGLGLTMAMLGLELVAAMPWFGLTALAALLLLVRVPGLPAAPLVAVAATVVALATGVVPALPALDPGFALPIVVLPALDDLPRALGLAVLPQLPLTLTNAVIVTVALSRDLFPAASGRVTEKNLALSSGIANLLLSPWGAMPMCHGAGGLQAQHRFGARTGAAPIMFGVLLVLLVLAGGRSTGELLAMVPMAVVGAMLLFAGADLALSKRLFDARPFCWSIIALTAVCTLLVNPAVGLLGGWLAEVVRVCVLGAGWSARFRSKPEP